MYVAVKRWPTLRRLHQDNGTWFRIRTDVACRNNPHNCISAQPQRVAAPITRRTARANRAPSLLGLGCSLRTGPFGAVALPPSARIRTRGAVRLDGESQKEA